MQRTDPDSSFYLLTVNETAQRLGCSTANVYALIQSGELPVVPVGRRKGYRIDIRDLAQFADNRKFRCMARVSETQPRHLRHLRFKS
jgi:excisionase family DNA binding protein